MVDQRAAFRQGTNPVGLENIAQTCYMNSLFQYYFTVKPLRDAILNHEELEEGELSEEELKSKQISKWELERSKRCISLISIVLILVIEQLRLLFQELITSDLAYIRPKEELIRLTLIDVKQEVEEEAVKRRQSLLTNVSLSMDSELPDLIELEDTSVPPVPVSSPTLIATSGEQVPEFESPVRQTSSQIANIHIGSEDTDYEFVNHESKGSSTSDQMSMDKENDQQARPVSASSTDKSLQGKSALQDSQKVNVMEVETKDPDDDVEMTDFGVMTPPKTPPPIPARPRRKSTWGVLKYGSQQDVTECITNCLSQLHAAFKPEEIDSKGDHIDMFKRYCHLSTMLIADYSTFE
jgi:ubiquitin carboxyl-terminal hydrolase 25/28